MKGYTTDGTSTPVDLPEAAFQQAFLAGKVGLPAGAVVHVQGEDGIEAVPVERAQAALAQPGASVASPEAFDAQERHAKYGGIGQQAITAVEQGLGGATLGVIPAIEGAVLGNREDILARREENPKLALGANAVGGVLPLLIPGAEEAGVAEEVGVLGNLASGAGTLARGIGAPTRIAGDLAGGVGGVVKDLLGASEDDSFVAALAKSAAAHGAEGATWGAITGATDHLTEESLGDPAANGESLLAATGHGALLGLGLGGALGATGELGGQVLGRLSPHFARGAEEAAVRSISPKAAAVLEELPGGVRAAGRRLLDDGIVNAGETSEQIAAKLPKAAAEADARVAQVLETADKAGGDGVSVGNVIKEGRKEVEALRAHPTGEAAANAVEKQLAGIERVMGIPSEEKAAGILGSVFGERQVILDSTKMSFAEAHKLSTQLEGPLKGIVQRELETSGEQAAKKMGGSFLEDYKDARLAADQYRALASAPPHPPGKGGNLTPAALALFSGHPLAAGTLAAGAMVKKYAAERGLSTATAVLDKLAALRGVERAVQSVDRQIARGISGAVPGAGIKAPVRLRGAVGGSYEERVATVQKAMQDAGATAAGAVGAIAEHAPQIASAFQASAVRATTYLAGLIPKNNRPPSLTPHLDKPPQATPTQKATFNRAFDVAHDPMVVLKAVQEGRVTSDQVKALATIYPALYARIVTQTQARLADAKTPLTSVQKHNLGILLQKPQDVDLARRFQATYKAMAADQPTMQNQDQQHKNRQRAGTWVPKRPIKSPAQDAALEGGGRPPGS